MNTEIKAWDYLHNTQNNNKHLFSSIWNEGYKILEPQLIKPPEIESLAIPYWNPIAINGKSDVTDFFFRLSRSIFNVNQYLRTWEERDYLPTRCRWHYTFGHLPFLTNIRYSNVLIALGILGTLVQDERKLKILSRWYWYTFEFSIILENYELKDLGAGIISSPGETDYAVGKNKHLSKDIRLPYNTYNIINSDYVTDTFQNKYFVINDFSEVEESLRDLYKWLL